MNNKISKKIKNINVSGIRRIYDLAKKFDNPIKLNIGLPDFPVKKSVIDIANRAMNDGLNEYTQTAGIDGLREKIARKLNKTQGLTYDNDNIIITLAGTGALSVAIATLVDPGDEVVIMDPNFVIYEPLVLQNNGVPIVVSMTEKFHLDLDEIENSITNKTKAIIINSPNNPTGKVYKEDELKKLAEIAGKNNIVIISDEVYKDFVYGKEKHVSISKFYKNTLIVDSFSKTYAVTGWRVGYLAGPKDILSEAIKVEQFNYVCPPTPFQYGCIEAMDWDISEHIEEYEKRADFVYESLKDKYEISKPEGAFYFFIKFPYNSEEFMKKCFEKKLLVVPGESFSKKNTHFRISFATSDSNLKEAMKILNSLV